MTPGELTTYCLKHGCEVIQGGYDQMIWIKSDSGEAFINPKRNPIFRETVIAICMRLRIPIP